MTLRHHVDVKTSSALPYMADRANVYYSCLCKYKLLLIDLFRGACAVKGNVQVAGHVKRVDHGAVFYAFFMGHHDQYGQN